MGVGVLGYCASVYMIACSFCTMNQQVCSDRMFKVIVFRVLAAIIGLLMMFRPKDESIWQPGELNQIAVPTARNNQKGDRVQC